MSPSTLSEKLKEHKFNINDIRGLAKAIQFPIMVYNHGVTYPNKVLITEMNIDDNRMAVSLIIDKNGNIKDVDNISSIHPKDVMTEMERLSKLNEKELTEAMQLVNRKKFLIGSMQPASSASCTTKIRNLFRLQR